MPQLDDTRELVSILVQSGQTPIVYDSDELIRMFGLSGERDQIPFIEDIDVSMETVPRLLTVAIDNPRYQGGIKDNAAKTATATIASRHRSDFRKNTFRWKFTAAEDGTKRIRIMKECTRTLALVLDTADEFNLNIWFRKRKGVMGFNEDIQRLGDRRKMDLHDSDEAGDSYFRMGNIRQMGARFNQAP